MRAVDPSHPFIEAIVGQLGELRADGTFSDEALRTLAATVQGLSAEKLADALWHALVFSAFIDSKLGAEGAAAQLLTFVEAQAARLPADTRASLDASRAAARALGTEGSLVPVGSAPTPEGSVRGGLAARLASPPKAASKP